MVNFLFYISWIYYDDFPYVFWAINVIFGLLIINSCSYLKFFLFGISGVHNRSPTANRATDRPRHSQPFCFPWFSPSVLFAILSTAIRSPYHGLHNRSSSFRNRPSFICFIYKPFLSSFISTTIGFCPLLMFLLLYSLLHSLSLSRNERKAFEKPILKIPPTIIEKFIALGSKQLYVDLYSKLKVVYGRTFQQTPDVLGFSPFLHVFRSSFLLPVYISPC